MSYFDDASLVLIPSGYKTSKVYSVKPTDGSGDLTFTRASTATRVNSSGVIEAVASNVPRLDYSGGATCPKLLLEPQRTNLVFPSNVATTQTQTVTATAHTLSFYGTGNVVLSGVTTATLTGTGANNRVALTFTPTAGSLILTISGTVTNWQLEAGSYATSYIPTTTASVTRVADAASKTGISSLIGQTEGTLFAEVQRLNVGVSAVALQFNDGTNNNRVQIEIGSGGQTFAICSNAGATTCLITGPTLTLGQTYKIAFSYKVNDFKLFVDGVSGGVDTSGAVPVSMSRLDLASEAGTSYAGFALAQALHFKTALTSTQLAELTA
jgi:hypothetical protein